MIESTQTLLRRVQDGDEQALDTLVGRFRVRLTRWAHGRLPAHVRALADTDDVVQDALVRTMRHFAAFDPRSDTALEAYVRRALLNRIREEIRRRRGEASVTTALSDGLASDAPSPASLAETAEARSRYEHALGALDEDDRLAIIGRIELGYTFAEVASLVGKRTPDAARKHTERALRALAEQLRDARG